MKTFIAVIGSLIYVDFFQSSEEALIVLIGNAILLFSIIVLCFLQDLKELDK